MRVEAAALIHAVHVLLYISAQVFCCRPTSTYRVRNASRLSDRAPDEVCARGKQQQINGPMDGVVDHVDDGFVQDIDVLRKS